ncbi:hypothetical protein AJ79_05773 [Helicocarpus griseus UAMH5409]|uniref:Mitotic checkpoint regulator, MAD2B-interacting-domain-containing protein n=1 Tax=Helicocarpus griseus UAMH5409 TaxID=1447875 RepID=A0A2B7XBL5_9EURO|nr:hypothetical protein AJ79_05773 [Helicocarpus griseus UAMH5409]
MALVSYSDSEGSDSESTPSIQAVEKKRPPPQTPTITDPNSSKPTFQPLVDRRNPRKILVNLPDTGKSADSDAQGTDDGDDDGPAKKRARIGGGGGAFSGFNSFLPAPKRTGPVKAGADKKGDGTGPARKVFSLKTGAEPGFDRQADAQMKWDMSNGAAAGATGAGADGIGGENGVTTPGAEKMEDKPEQKSEIKPKGNAMMFKPLSVARGVNKKKRTTAIPPPSTSSGNADKAAGSSTTTTQQAKTEDTVSRPAPKPKVSLFGLGREEEQVARVPQASSSTYEPLIYNTPSDAQSLGPNPSTTTPARQPSEPPAPPQPQQPQTLASIADDLNLSRAEKRQLLGRQGFSGPSNATATQNPNIITFNTDQEYTSNAAYLMNASEAELAAQQHNPVRSIAPGKHSLQQLVNAASNQREALEESFAAGKRNKKEAGSRYGW